jgi:hypothetical protein
MRTIYIVVGDKAGFERTVFSAHSSLKIAKRRAAALAVEWAASIISVELDDPDEDKRA